MGPKVKKAPKNAFSFFLDEYVENLRNMGRQISHRVAAEQCAPLWQVRNRPEQVGPASLGHILKARPNKFGSRPVKDFFILFEELSPAEKERYTQLAKAFKEYSKEDKGKKFTSIGISYAQLEKEQEELRLKTEEADTEIKMTISNLDSDLLRVQLFYIIHCNYYCKTDTGMYVPGELAVVEFNLEDGIRRTYHRLIDPGNIPLGYAFEAKQSIEQIHGLPYPPYEEGDSDYCGILNKLLDFMELGKLPDGRYPPLYCNENNLKASENILRALCDSGSDGENHFRVFHLQKMFFWLKNKCVENLCEESVGFPVLSNAESEISKDVFCYTPGISCTFHVNSEEKYYNCSLSIVQRLVYIICDHCCQYVDVKLIPGKHCGLKCDTEREATRARLERFSRKSSPPSFSTEVDFDDRCSSYFAEMSTFESRREGGSFLHEEIESTFGGCDVSSVSSFASGSASAFEVPRSRRRRMEEAVVDDSYSETSRKLPFGRGAGFR